MTVSREDVIFAYRLLLNRLPESEAAISQHAHAEDLGALLRNFLGSAEFQQRMPGLAGASRLPLDVPALEVETDCSDEDAAKCLAEIRKTWTQLGLSRPHFSVLTHRRFLPENIAGSLEHFWGTGQLEATRVADMVHHHGGADLAGKTCVEFGCGVGRVTMGLARHCAMVHAYDISATHLALARHRARETAATNVVFHLCSGDVLANLESCDLFYSTIVFQHNPPVIITRLIRNALRSLKQAGIAIFQVPTYDLGYRFKTADWLAATHPPDMQMHCLPQERIFELIAEEGCELREVREDDWAGPSDQRLSNTFVVRKSPAPAPSPPSRAARR
jgi:SAM-dependent methyltransferase